MLRMPSYDVLYTNYQSKNSNIIAKMLNKQIDLI